MHHQHPAHFSSWYAGELYDGLLPWPRNAAYASGRWGRSFGTQGIDPILVPLWASELWALFQNWWWGTYWGGTHLSSLTDEQQQALTAYRKALKITAPPWAYLPYNAKETDKRIRAAGGVLATSDEAALNGLEESALEQFVLRVGQEYVEGVLMRQEQSRPVEHEAAVAQNVDGSNERSTVKQQQQLKKNQGGHARGAISTEVRVFSDAYTSQNKSFKNPDVPEKSSSSSREEEVTSSFTVEADLHRQQDAAATAQVSTGQGELQQNFKEVVEQLNGISMNAARQQEVADEEVSSGAFKSSVQLQSSAARTRSTLKPVPTHTVPRWMMQAAHAGVYSLLHACVSHL